MRVVGRSAHAHKVADDATRDRRGEAPIAARQVTRHVAAVAVSGDSQPIRVGEPFCDEGVDWLEEVPRVRLAPVFDSRPVEVLAIAIASARVQQ